MIVQTYVDIIKLEDILSRLNIAMAHPLSLRQKNGIPHGVPLLLFFGGFEGETVQSNLPADGCDRGRPSAQSARDKIPFSPLKTGKANTFVCFSCFYF